MKLLEDTVGYEAHLNRTPSRRVPRRQGPKSHVPYLPFELMAIALAQCRHEECLRINEISGDPGAIVDGTNEKPASACSPPGAPGSVTRRLGPSPAAPPGRYQP
jgi:hypothetical protein